MKREKIKQILEDEGWKPGLLRLDMLYRDIQDICVEAQKELLAGIIINYNPKDEKLKSFINSKIKELTSADNETYTNFMDISNCRTINDVRTFIRDKLEKNIEIQGLKVPKRLIKLYLNNFSEIEGKNMESRLSTGKPTSLEGYPVYCYDWIEEEE